jgi:hypothetical protein
MSCPATETQYGTVTVTELTTSVVRTVVESPGAVRTNFVTGCATIVSGTCVGTTTSLVVTTEPRERFSSLPYLLPSNAPHPSYNIYGRVHNHQHSGAYLGTANANAFWTMFTRPGASP